MNIWEGVALAFIQIRTERLKSFFAVLGVIIGVMFLIVVVGVVEGLDRYIKEDFADRIFGLNTVTVRRRPSISLEMFIQGEQWREWSRRRQLNVDDFAMIRDKLSVPARVGVESSSRGQVEGDNGRAVENVVLIGASPEI
ncbi:MAG: ABC transporter permease, partial [Gemmatimonadota bacterium]